METFLWPQLSGMIGSHLGFLYYHWQANYSETYIWSWILKSYDNEKLSYGNSFFCIFVIFCMLYFDNRPVACYVCIFLTVLVV